MTKHLIITALLAATIAAQSYALWRMNGVVAGLIVERDKAVEQSNDSIELAGSLEDVGAQLRAETEQYKWLSQQWEILFDQAADKCTPPVSFRRAL